MNQRFHAGCLSTSLMRSRPPAGSTFASCSISGRTVSGGMWWMMSSMYAASKSRAAAELRRVADLVADIAEPEPLRRLPRHGDAPRVQVDALDRDRRMNARVVEGEEPEPAAEIQHAPAAGRYWPTSSRKRWRRIQKRPQQ